MTRPLACLLLALALVGCDDGADGDEPDASSTGSTESADVAEVVAVTPPPPDGGAPAPDASVPATDAAGAPATAITVSAGWKPPQAVDPAQAIEAATAAGLLSPLDRRLFVRLRLGGDEGSDGAAFAREIREAARQGEISPPEYAAFRAILSTEKPPEAELVELADALVRPAEERVQGVVRAYAFADVLRCTAEQAQRGPSRWFKARYGALRARLSAQRDEAISEMTALLERNDASAEVRRRLRSVRAQQRMADAESEKLELLEQLVVGPSQASESVDLPERP